MRGSPGCNWAAKYTYVLRKEDAHEGCDAISRALLDLLGVM